MRNSYYLHRGYVDAVARSALLGKACWFLAFAMVFTLEGAQIGMQLSKLWILGILGVFALAAVIRHVRDMAEVSLVLFFLLAATLGFSLSGLVESCIASGAGLVVQEVAEATGILSIGMALAATVTGSYLSGRSGTLFVSWLAVVAASVVGVFIGATIVEIAIGIGCALIFGNTMLSEVNRIRYIEDSLTQGAWVTVRVYLSMINACRSIVDSILGFGGGHR